MTEANVMQKRNSGLDLLRLISMFFVLILHTLGKGGVLDKATVDTGMYAAAWYMEVFAYCAVNVFAITSGYVSYSDSPRKTRLSSYILLWLQVVFYGVATHLVFKLIFPDTVHLRATFDMLFPVKNDLYWYFTAYTGLFVIKPILDHGMASFSKETARKLLVAIILVFSCFEIFYSRFKLGRGYSFVWISLLYVLGAIIKKCDIGNKLSPIKGFLAIVALCTGTWLWKLYVSDRYVSYVSPTILCASILYVIIFSKIKFGEGAKKVIRFAAPGAFAVYILNCQRDVWNIFMQEQFAFLVDRPIAAMVAVTLGFAALFVVCAVLIDRIRQWLFDVFRIKKLAGTVDGIVDAAVSFVSKKL